MPSNPAVADDLVTGFLQGSVEGKHVVLVPRGSAGSFVAYSSSGVCKRLHWIGLQRSAWTLDRSFLAISAARTYPHRPCRLVRSDLPNYPYTRASSPAYSRHLLDLLYLMSMCMQADFDQEIHLQPPLPTPRGPSVPLTHPHFHTTYPHTFKSVSILALWNAHIPTPQL